MTSRVCEQPVLSLSCHISQTVVGILSFLHALEINKWIMLRGVEIDQCLLFIRQPCQDSRSGGEEPVAVVHAIRPGGRQTFLIALPAVAPFGQLIGDGSAGIESLLSMLMAPGTPEVSFEKSIARVAASVGDPVQANVRVFAVIRRRLPSGRLVTQLVVPIQLLSFNTPKLEPPTTSRWFVKLGCATAK